MGTIIRAAALYGVLLLILRVVPRRTGNIMTPFEFVLIFLIGGMGVQAVVADDRSFTNAVLGIATVGLIHTAVATLKQRYESFGKVADGTPVIVLENGHWHEDRLAMLRVQEQDVMAAARQDGIDKVEQIRCAVVERNGAISIFKEDAA